MKKEKKRVVGCIAAAFLALISGGVNAMFGGGGGMLIVPALSWFLKVEEKRSHAGAIAIILPLSVLSVVLMSTRGVSNYSLAVKVGIGAIFGGAIGAIVLKKIPKTALSLLFYGVMIYAGIRFLL